MLLFASTPATLPGQPPAPRPPRRPRKRERGERSPTPPVDKRLTPFYFQVYVRPPAPAPRPRSQPSASDKREGRKEVPPPAPAPASGLPSWYNDLPVLKAPAIIPRQPSIVKRERSPTPPLWSIPAWKGKVEDEPAAIKTPPPPYR
ncbi:MAG: hypothetical protein Q9202_004371 [Teloschistes flavicans]